MAAGSQQSSVPLLSCRRRREAQVLLQMHGTLKVAAASEAVHPAMRQEPSSWLYSAA